jgi:hypothetical protein
MSNETRKKRQQSPDEVVRSLSKKNDVQIKGQTINVLKNTARGRRNDLGNGSFGKIDFLVNHNGFHKVMVDSFKSPQSKFKRK